MTEADELVGIPPALFESRHARVPSIPPNGISIMGPGRIPIVEMPTGNGARRTLRSPTTTRPSDQEPAHQPFFTAAASPIRTRRIFDTQSRTTARPSIVLIRDDIRSARAFILASGPSLTTQRRAGPIDERLQCAIRLAPLDPDLYYNRGLLFTAMNEPDRAIADFSRAIAGFDPAKTSVASKLTP